MIYKPVRLGVVALFALAGACDEGYGIDVTINVTADIAGLYSPEDRGLVVTRIANGADGVAVTQVGVVCGQAVTWNGGSFGFGALPDSSVAVWIERLPADDERACGEIADPEGSPNDDWTRDEDEPQAGADVKAAEGCNASNQESIELTLAVAN